MERKVISYKSVVDKMNELRNVVYDSEKDSSAALPKTQNGLVGR